MKVQKNQLLKFLEIVQLKGLDPRGKENPTFEDCVLLFYPQENKVTSYGANVGNSIFFNHIMHMEISDTESEYTELVIPDIRLWVKYLTDLPGEEITLKEDRGFIIISGDGSSYYQVPMSDRLVASSVAALVAGPIIGADSEAELGITNHYENMALSEDEWATFDFDPEPLANATDAGRNVETLTTSITIKKNNLAIEVGKLPSAGIGPKYVQSKVEGFVSTSWLWNARAEQSWIGVVGINPICRTLIMLENTQPPEMLYKSSINNILVRTVESTVEDVECQLIWMVSPLADQQGEVQDRSGE